MQILPQMVSAPIPTPQPPAGLRYHCIPEMDPHNRRGWGWCHPFPGVGEGILDSSTWKWSLQKKTWTWESGL